ncbi:MAG: hypothetical protein GQ470_07400 [Gammaproteobacteria bacterium]|nr:hypothetical protein [Gammaproteobacteria bacterium]
MTPMNSRLFFIAALFCCSPLLSADERWSVNATEWAQPRSGEMIVSLPGVRSAMQAVSERPDNRLTIHHPGGDQGIWWAEELRGWLITLGVNSSRIELVPGGGEPDMMYLSIIESRTIKSQIIDPKRAETEE